MGHNVNQAIEALKNNDVAKALAYLDTKDTIFDEWSISDVECRYDDRKDDGDKFKKRLTDKRAQEILHLCQSEMNAEVGINYDVIDSYTDDVLGVK